MITPVKVSIDLSADWAKRGTFLGPCVLFPHRWGGCRLPDFLGTLITWEKSESSVLHYPADVLFFVYGLAALYTAFISRYFTKVATYHINSFIKMILPVRIPVL